MIARRQRVPRAAIQGLSRMKPGRYGVIVVRKSHFSVRARKNEFGYNRFAVVIGKNVAPRAVKRNALKRIIAAAITNWQNKGTDFLITAQKRSPTIMKKEIQEELNAVIEKIFLQ